MGLISIIDTTIPDRRYDSLESGLAAMLELSRCVETAGTDSLLAVLLRSCMPARMLHCTVSVVFCEVETAYWLRNLFFIPVRADPAAGVQLSGIWFRALRAEFDYCLGP